MTEQEKKLVAWYKEEFAYRTANVSENLNWILEDYRVCWTEVLSKADELNCLQNLDAVATRLRWQELIGGPSEENKWKGKKKCR